MQAPQSRDDLPGIELFDLDTPIEKQVRQILDPHYKICSKNVSVGESTMFKLADPQSEAIPLVITSTAGKATRLPRLLLEAKRLRTRVLFLIEDNAIPPVQCLEVADRLRFLHWPMAAETLLSEVAREIDLLQPSGSKEAAMSVQEAIKLAQGIRRKILKGIGVTAFVTIASLIPVMYFLPRTIATPLVFSISALAAIVSFYYLIVAFKQSV